MQLVAVLTGGRQCLWATGGWRSVGWTEGFEGNNFLGDLVYVFVFNVGFENFERGMAWPREMGWTLKGLLALYRITRRGWRREASFHGSHNKV
jgi:hypothetical protein